ncbi:hypothetical protein FDP41_006197 [Naegleria fowleri]|uniref:Ubiquitin carboxyl-terminal hydrolase n=1 Tax=Naegleria fowleri TaxID=5763 RepID=A0A6A5B902_NAEFO|nr:uncharacterized protein FDP41_006197 [Naegleria fowleri]KAF0974723.1 hypothetical protein FDP41_006197 [Naegleria fowleri]CAG4708791.1 unnamed protein product [Naegleria fowleri]
MKKSTRKRTSNTSKASSNGNGDKVEQSLSVASSDAAIIEADAVSAIQMTTFPKSLQCSHFRDFVKCKAKRKHNGNCIANGHIGIDDYEELVGLNENLIDLGNGKLKFEQTQHCTCCENPFSLIDEAVICSNCYHIFTVHTFYEKKSSFEKAEPKQLKYCPNCKDNAIVFHLTYKEFFCLECFDFITLDFEAIKYILLPCLFKSANQELPNEKQATSTKKKRKFSHPKSGTETVPHISVGESIKSMLKNNVQTQTNPLIGLRGIVNLGNTCFMNCILQTLAHNVSLRNYYLSGVYSQLIEKEIENDSKCKNFEDIQTYLKMSRAMNNLFKEMYDKSCNELENSNIKKRSSNGKRKSDTVDEQPIVLPYVPHQFLYIMWNIAGHLAGYQQQDAHEFYMAILSALTPAKLPNNRRNLIEDLFTGTSQSDLNCKICSSISSTVEAFMDISLPLKAKSGDTWIELESLTECLERYTRDENLDISSYSCKNCGSQGNFSKQIRFKRLPYVLCFHLKRFEHSEVNRNRRTAGVSSKIDWFVSFPLQIEMKDFVVGEDGGVPDNKYSLFSVVCHHGDLSGGHYTCYVKHNSRWFLCNDSSVYYAKESDVLNSEAYLLFYERAR